VRIVVMIPLLKGRVYDHRLRLPLEQLERNGKADIIWADSISAVLHGIKGADIFLSTRPAEAEMLSILAKCKQYGVKVVVDMDDALHVIPHRNPFYVVWGTQIDIIEKWQDILASEGVDIPAIAWATQFDAHMVARMAKGRLYVLEQCLKQADLVTVTCSFLANFYKKLLHLHNVKIIPNCVSEEEFRGIERRVADGGRVRIRWGGSPTHYDDLAIIHDPMAQAMKACPHIDFDTVGLSQAGYHFMNQLPRDRFTCLDAKPHHEYMQWLADADIIIAPSDKSKFSMSKSDLRVLEAGYLGVPVVASAVTYGATVSKYKMGIVVRNPRDWTKGIVSLARNPAMRDRYGRNGRHYVRTHRTYERQWSWWYNAYQSLCASGDTEH